MPRKSRNTRGVWDDLDSRLDATDKLARDFFSDTQAVSVGQIPASELELSDEEITDHAVEVRVDSDGFVSQVPEEESAPAEMLELMPVPLKLGATDWGSQFAEIHARVQELQCVSKPTSNRYVVRAHGNLKVSSLPSGVDFICDVCIVARACLNLFSRRSCNFAGMLGSAPDCCRLASIGTYALMRKILTPLRL